MRKKKIPIKKSVVGRLESEQQEEGHHQTEETHGFRERKAQDGIGKQLLFQGWIAGIADNQTAKDTPNSSSGSGDTDGSRTSADKFGCRVDIPTRGTGLEGAELLELSLAEASRGGQERLLGRYFRAFHVSGYDAD